MSTVAAHLAPTTEPLWFLEALAYVRADATATSGLYGLSEFRAPRGHASPLHTHTREDETFFVLDGELQFWSGDGRPVRHGAGGLVVLPRDVPHAFAVVSDEARFCVLTTPGGFEELFRTGVPAAEEILPTGPMQAADIDRAMRALERLGVAVLGPPPELPTR